MLSSLETNLVPTHQTFAAVFPKKKQQKRHLAVDAKLRPSTGWMSRLHEIILRSVEIFDWLMTDQSEVHSNAVNKGLRWPYRISRLYPVGMYLEASSRVDDAQCDVVVFVNDGIRCLGEPFSLIEKALTTFEEVYITCKLCLWCLLSALN